MDRVGCDVVQPGCDTEHVATFFVQTDGEKMHDVIFLDLFLQGSNLNIYPKSSQFLGVVRLRKRKKSLK